ncbi:MAG TPA: CbiX/SirB N-terminal domain-containing protein [Microbacteriaceae bacterium]|nr:CbiX/SirB N-terminal domain-containing protein [Microbacteriaceae bacterium]
MSVQLRTDAARPDAQPPGRHALRPSLLAVSHGTNSADGREAIAGLVAAVASALPSVHVSSSFVDVQQPDLDTGLDAIGGSAQSVVVPLLLSAGYHVHVDIARSLHGRASESVQLAKALGPDDALVQILASRLAAAGLAPGDSIVLAAAGSSDHRAVRDCLEMGRRLGALLGRPVTVGFLSAAVPRLDGAIETARQLHPGRRVVVGSYVLAPGYFADLAAAAGGDVTSEPLLIAGSRPPGQLVDLVVERYRVARAV